MTARRHVLLMWSVALSIKMTPILALELIEIVYGLLLVLMYFRRILIGGVL